MAGKGTKRSLYWFSNDLRVEDNEAFASAYEQSSQLFCVYVIDPKSFDSNSLQNEVMGRHRYEFLLNNLWHLKNTLQNISLDLVVLKGAPQEMLFALATQFKLDTLYHSRHSGLNERRLLANLDKVTKLHRVMHDTHTLFKSEQLPCAIADLPRQFTPFKNAVSHLQPLKKHGLPDVRSDLDSVEIGDFLHEHNITNTLVKSSNYPDARQTIADYFSGESPAHYKETRNELYGHQTSTRFSHWLSMGVVSAREIAWHVKEYEQTVVANKSTQWILFELLWREFFQWRAHQIDQRLFSLTGTQSSCSATSRDQDQFDCWVGGLTAAPLVNACMRELRETGFLSNRGRQIVASYFVNELDMDWRLGARYFEEQLIDFDVASNWGNWQYLAGVGPDPRGKRRFNIVKQTHTYDGSGEYQKRWLNA